MHDLLRKLNFRDQPRLVAIAPPPELAATLADIAAEVPVAARPAANEEFALVFVRSSAEIARRVPTVVAKLAPDALLWIAYPKKSSTRYSSDLGRDESWGPLGELGYEGVRQIAIDEDWSALRFRKPEFIATMRRDPSRAMSRAGRRRTATGT